MGEIIEGAENDEERTIRLRQFVFQTANFVRFELFRSMSRTPLSLRDDSPSGVESVSTDPSLAMLIEEAIQSCTDSERTSFELVHEQGHSCTEAAQEQNLSPVALRCSLHRARKRMQRFLGED